MAVTKKEENVQVFNNKTIYELHELLDIRENGVVVIATTPRYSFNMYNYAALLGFKDIIMLHWNF